MQVRKVPAESLFVTPEFRESGWIAGICKEVGDVWVTRDQLIPGHFGTYFGALGIREYANPYVQDLYHLHEIAHVRHYAYEPKADFRTWCESIINSEFFASVTSECLVYLHVPGLRAKTFAHPIWVDQFLATSGGGSETARTSLTGRIMTERVRALTGPRPNDFLEQQIANYCRQNWTWCTIWSEPLGVGPHADMPAFRVVESHMADPERDATHERWLREVSVFDAGAQRPFYRQANAFRPVYEETGRRFGNHLLSR